MHHFARQRDGRAQRRAAARLAERQRHNPVPRPVHIPMLIKVDYVLAPLEAVLSQIELRGTVDALRDGTPIFQAADGTWCATAPAVEGIADFFGQWATRHGQTLDVSPLTQLAARLEYAMPVDAPTLEGLRDLLPNLRRIASAMSRDEAESLIRGTQIRQELDALDGRG